MNERARERWLCVYMPHHSSSSQKHIHTNLFSHLIIIYFRFVEMRKQRIERDRHIWKRTTMQFITNKQKKIVERKDWNKTNYYLQSQIFLRLSLFYISIFRRVRREKEREVYNISCIFMSHDSFRSLFIHVYTYLPIFPMIYAYIHTWIVV